MLFAVFSASLMFLWTQVSEKWLFPIIRVVCCDHTLMHPVVMIRLGQKQQFLQQETDQEAITPTAITTTKA